MRGCHATEAFFLPSLNDTPNGFFDSAVRVDEVGNYTEKWSPQAMADRRNCEPCIARPFRRVKDSNRVSAIQRRRKRRNNDARTR